MSVTLKDIAQRAGVAPTVVSAVLHGSKRIRFSEKKKAEILALVREMGYSRNPAASALRSGKTHLIGIAMPAPKVPFYAAMMSSLQNVLRDAGYTAVFGLWGKENPVGEVFSSLFNLKIDGAITWELPDHPEKLDFPVVHYNHCRVSESVDTVLLDVENTVDQTMAFLKKKHFRKIGFIGNVDDHRITLLQERCGKAGMEIRPEWNFNSLSFGTDTQRRIPETYMKLKEKPELLVFTDDMVCAAVSSVLKPQNVLPELLCFRNSYLLNLIGKPMTAFDIHEEDIASALAEMLLSRLKAPALPARCRKIKSELVTIERFPNPDNPYEIIKTGSVAGALLNPQL